VRIPARLRREVVVSAADIASARRRLVWVALAVTAADLLVKAVAHGPAAAEHHRSFPQLVAIALIVGYGAYVLPLFGTPRVATAGGLIVGAGLGNVLSALIWGSVPNPFALGILSVAFNLADVAAVLGLILLVSGARRLSAPPPKPPPASPPPPVRQTQPTRHEDWNRPAEGP
jgi:lipoprotein signal peptidase